MDVQTLAVVGAGQMGAGIAQAGAQSGLQVILIDVSPELVQIHWLAADAPALLRSAPTLRAPAGMLPAGVPVIQTQALAGWTQVWDPLLDRRGRAISERRADQRQKQVC